MPRIKLNCTNQLSVLKSATLDDFNDDIFCDCPPTANNSISWYDEKCNLIVDNDNFSVGKTSLKISKTENIDEEWTLFCTDAGNCSNAIHVIMPDTNPVEEGISPGVKAFLVIIVLCIILLITYLVYKKCKHQIYLCCRDTCTPANSNDGKEYDAYVSVGKSTNDMKFVQRNIVDVLERKYNYKFFIDDDNILPQLDYSEKAQSKLHKCRRLIVIFTPAYMANDWCMYCFSEGLRKLLELNIQMIFIISDVTIQRELNSLSSLIGHVPKVFISFLPKPKNKKEKDAIVQKIRLVLSPPSRSSTNRRGMRAPMLSEVEDIDEMLVCDNESSKDTKYSTLDNSSINQEIEEKNSDQEMERDEEDPNSIKVHQYKAKKNFYSITVMPNE